MEHPIGLNEKQTSFAISRERRLRDRFLWRIDDPDKRTQQVLARRYETHGTETTFQQAIDHANSI